VIQVISISSFGMDKVVGIKEDTSQQDTDKQGNQVLQSLVKGWKEVECPHQVWKNNI
jgi:hypothetical protein